MDTAGRITNSDSLHTQAGSSGFVFVSDSHSVWFTFASDDDAYALSFVLRITSEASRSLLVAASCNRLKRRGLCASKK